MDFNPHNASYAAAQARISELSERERKIAGALDWYRNVDLNAIREELRERQARSAQLESELAALESEMKLEEVELAELASRLGCWFNPANWFAPDQRELRRRRRQLRDLNIEKNAVKRVDVGAMQIVRDKIEELASVVRRHAAFDLDSQESELRNITQSLASAKNSSEDVARRKRNVDEILAPLLEQLVRLRAEKHEAELQLQEAGELERRLSDADNSYQRAMIHEECERRFGTGKPRSVIHDQNRIIRQTDRDLEKATRRVEEIGRKAARVVKALVVDGNNLCYEGSRFVGLSAIESLLPVLSNEYSIVVVFDASIRRMLKADDSWLRKRFQAYATIHVVATRESADKTILDLASPDTGTYVLSNDRFGDFNEKQVVKDGRIIRHEIISGRVFIHDLHINVSRQ